MTIKIMKVWDDENQQLLKRKVIIHDNKDDVEKQELTTEELCNKIKKITGKIPYLIKHYQGRREGNFYDTIQLWEASVRSGTYLIDDDGSVIIK